jgi:hypothetical protein
MEEMVWVYVGIIAVVISLGIIGQVFLVHEEDLRGEEVRASLDKMEAECKYACTSPQDSYVGVDVTLPSAMRLWTAENRICALYKTKTSCRACSCNLTTYTLNLNSTLALSSFKTHEYSCNFLRRHDDIALDCKG